MRDGRLRTVYVVHFTPPPMRRSRNALVLVSLVLAWACGEGIGPDTATVPLDIAPSFQLLPGTFDSPPIDRVVLEVTDVETSAVVATADVTVDPNADSWSIPISVDLGDQESIYVLVQILLYSGSTVAWSGLEGPILVGAGQSALARSVQVYRGPLDNLDVTSVTIPNPPAVLTVGDSVTLSADLTLVQGSSATPEVFWASSDEAVATVTSTGSTVTLAAVGAGTVDIIAAAGAAYDEFTVTVGQGVPAGFDTQWEGTTNDWSTATNWSAGQVPLATDNVYIPVSAVDPLLSANVEVADLTIAPGASLELFDGLIAVSGDLDAGTTITGSGSVDLIGSGTTVRGAIETQLSVSGTVSANGTVTVSDAMYVDGSLSVGGQSFSVGDVYLSGTLSVGAGGTLGSSGTLTLNNGSTLNVDGTVTATNGCVDQGATITGTGTTPCGGGGGGSGTTKTWVGGTTGVETDWHTASNWSPPGEPGASDTVVVSGSSYNPATSTDVTIAAITVGSPNSVDINGDMFVDGDVNTTTGGGLLTGYVVVTGSGSVLQGTFGNLDIQADRVASGQIYVLGDLTLFGARLDVADQPVSVSGNLGVNGAGAALVMNTPTSQPVTVFGNASFNGDDETGLLTEGTLQLGGDLIATSASSGSFVASGNHSLYLFGGSGGQSVQFQIPGQNAQRVNDLTISNVTGVTFDSDAIVSGNATLFGSTSVPATSNVNVIGDLTMANGTVLQLDGAISVGGVCDDQGAIIFGSGTPPCGSLTAVDKVWVGGSSADPSGWQVSLNWLPNGVPSATDAVLVPFSNTPPTLSADGQVGALTVALSGSIDEATHTLTVNGDAVVDGSVSGGLTIMAATASIQGYFEDLQIDAPVALSDITYAFGNLDIRAPVTVGAFPLYAALDLIVQGSGLISMTDPASQLFVDGNATFDGASSVGQLTDGVMAFNGDLSVSSTNSPTSFQAAGTVTYLNGTLDQTLSFDNPGPSGQFLGEVQIYQGGQGPALIFNTDVVAVGDVFATNAILRQGGRSTFEVNGSLNLSSVTVDALPLRVDSPVAPNQHTMDNVTFTGAYQGSDTQLYVSLPGADVNAPFLLNSPIFETYPTTGYHIHAVNRTVGGPILAVELRSPTPAGPPNYVLEGTNTVILWP